MAPMFEPFRSAARRPCDDGTTGGKLYDDAAADHGVGSIDDGSDEKAGTMPLGVAAAR